MQRQRYLETHLMKFWGSTIMGKWSRDRLWAVALALAACALAARGEEELCPWCARCTPEAGERCQETENPQEYLIDGVKYYFAYDGYDDICVLNCWNIKLDDVTWPRYPQLMPCENMMLSNCATSEGVSYVEALRRLNVTISKKLIMLFLPQRANVTADDLRDAPPSLELFADEADGVLELQPGAMANSSGLRDLHLVRVRVDVLPPHLDSLRLTNFGAEELPTNALAVQLLEIEDDQLLTIAGSAPRMRELSLTTPALESLTLYDADLQVLYPGFAQKVGGLRLLALERMRGRLYEGLLRGAAKLRTFKAIACALNVLPKDLFSYSHRLEHIDLSKNNLTDFPSGLFTGLKKLDTLLLMNNQLTALSINPLATLYQLTVLDLSENPLGDLCTFGDPSPLSPLRQLRALRLARVSLSHLCGDWLRDMRALADLDLRSNNITSLSCADLRVTRNSSCARIDLTNNTVAHIYCKQSDYTSMSELVNTQGLTMVLSSEPECTCDVTWFRQVAKRYYVNLKVPNREGPGFCSLEYIQSLGCHDALGFPTHP